MHRICWPWLGAAVLAMAVAPSIAATNAGSGIATTDSPFVNRVADEFRKVLPEHETEVVDELTISLGMTSQSPDQRLQVNVDRIADYCTRAPDRCTEAISSFVAKTAAFVQEQVLAPTLAGLRAVVRPQKYVSHLNSLVASRADEVISAPLAGDLEELCYIDMPTAMRPALKSDLEPLGLSREQALQTCRSNTRQALRAIPTVPAGQNMIRYLQGDAYESSYMLFHDVWAPVAQNSGGHLLVSVPASDMVIFTPDDNAAALDALSTLTAKAYGTAERPISRAVFRWTASGWDIAAP